MIDTIAEAQKITRPDLEIIHAPWAEQWAMEDTLPNVLVGARFAPDNTRIVEMRTDAVVDLFCRKSIPGSGRGVER